MGKKHEWVPTPEQAARNKAAWDRYAELHNGEIDDLIFAYFKNQARRAKPVIHDKP